MGDFYKVFIDAAAYPHTPPRCVKIEKGDVIYISNTDGDEVLKAGDKYKDYNAVVTEVIKEPKRWWQFWKKPKVYGYQIMFQ